MTDEEMGVLRTVCALSVLGAPPTLVELFQQYEEPVLERLAQSDRPFSHAIVSATQALVSNNVLCVFRARFLLTSMRQELEPLLIGEEWLPRKWRKAKRIASWLVRLAGVRAVYLCNRTAFGMPHDKGDLDFLVIVRHGSIWQTRGFATLPFLFLRDRPDAGVPKQDVVCLSFFVSDRALDVAPCALQPDDPYVRYWFLGLLPLADDGVGQDFWDANQTIRARHPHAKRWISSPALSVSFPAVRIPICSWLESCARSAEWRYFPESLRMQANRDTRVMISDERLKFHANDGRESVRTRYHALCASYGISH